MKNRTSLVGPGVLLLKLGPKLLKVISTFAKSAKLLLFGTSAATYTVIFGWKTALMILAFLFIHESGHLWAMKKRGMKTKGLYFIPFLGAAAVTKEEFPSREAESYVALMGPTFGLVLAALSYVAFLIVGDLEFIAAAGWMALITLLNLLPIMPLDGGRVLRSIAFSMNSQIGFAAVIAGMAVGGYFAFQNGFFLFVVLIPIGLIETFADWHRNRKRIKDLAVDQEFFARFLELRKEAEEQEATHVLTEIDDELIKPIKTAIDQYTALIRSAKSSAAIIKSIAWAVVLVAASFFLLYEATGATLDVSFFEILE